MRASRSIARASLAALVCALSLPARADLPPKALELSKATSDQVEALTGKTQAKGDLPRLIIPDEAAILNPFWDTKTLLGTAPYRKQDLGTLMDLLQKRNAVFTQYVTFKPNGVAEADVSRNLSVFQDEIFRSMHFLVTLVGAVIPALNDQIGKRKAADLPPKVLEGLREARDGMQQMVDGGVEMLTHPGLRPENQALVVDALAETAPALAAGLSAKGRSALAEAARSALPSLRPESKDRLQVLITALTRQPCEGLCLIE